MIHVGYPIEFSECICLLNGGVYDNNFNLEKYLEDKNSVLKFWSIDKNLYFLGVAIDDFDYRQVSDMIMVLQYSSNQVKNEMKRLNVDMSVVKIARMEGDEVEVHNPEPYVLSF